MTFLGRGVDGVRIGDDFAATLGELHKLLQDALWVTKREKRRPGQTSTAERVLVQLTLLRLDGLDVVCLATNCMINEI